MRSEGGWLPVTVGKKVQKGPPGRLDAGREEGLGRGLDGASCIEKDLGFGKPGENRQDSLKPGQV